MERTPRPAAPPRNDASEANPGGFSVYDVERPDQKLLVYYVLTSLIALPLFPVVFLPRLFRYLTLRYRFDEEGISVRWGVLFRREIHLTYSRIQDIHLSSNFVERWLELARIEIQTASGSAKAELTIEGVREFEEVRDFVYGRMRGLDSRQLAPQGASPGAGLLDERLASALSDVTTELKGARRALERLAGPDAEAAEDV